MEPLSRNLEHVADPHRAIPVWRTALTAVLVAGLMGMCVWTFWRIDWQYRLPTPRPDGLVQPPLGAHLVPAVLGPHLQSSTGRPVLLHFFNPACPCSRFNVGHLLELERTLGNRVTFIAVLQGSEPNRDAAFRDTGLRMAAIADADGSIARAFGVYATPQAVVLDEERALRYRGNYNISRYCTDPQTAFARLALEALLRGQSPQTVPAADLAYGCPLPSRQRPVV